MFKRESLSLSSQRLNLKSFIGKRTPFHLRIYLSEESIHWYLELKIFNFSSSFVTLLLVYKFLLYSSEILSKNRLAHEVHEKSIPPFKTDISWAIGDSISNSVPSRFQTRFLLGSWNQYLGLYRDLSFGLSGRKKRDDLSQEFMDSTEFRLIRFADFLLLPFPRIKFYTQNFRKHLKRLTKQMQQQAKERLCVLFH